jgi:tetratricopeptide (TPR) repeat protein
MRDHMNAEELLQAGIESARTGDMKKATSLLVESVKLNPNSELAWLWLGNCLASLKEREYCYKRALAINPGSAEAKQQLQRLKAPFTPLTSPPVEKPIQVKPVPQKDESKAAISPAAENPHPEGKSYTKIFASLTGFTLGLIIFGGLLAFIVNNGSFAKRTMPFAAVLWTPTHTLTATPAPTKKIAHTPTQTPTVIPSPTILTYTQRLKLADPFYTEGFKQYYDGKWAESILAWDEVIELVPEDEIAYRMRGDAYMKLLENNRFLDEYISNLGHAISDYDSAISIEPTNGDYYMARFHAYSALAGIQETRADYQEYEEISLQNLEMAYFYGTVEELAKRQILFNLLALGECDKAIEEINKQFKEQTEPSATLNTAMSYAQFCKGSPNAALKSVDKAITITESCERNTLRASILYAMGKYPEAEKEINITLNRCPYYGGGRYFLRGLIYIAMGDLEKAQQDLDFGYGETWGHGGLYPYALGKIALSNKDIESAISYFQEAEATYFNQDMILEMIRADLSKLDAKPLEIMPYPINATSIPTPTVSLTPRPTSTMQFTATPNKYNMTFTPDPILEYATTVNLETGTGPIRLRRNEELLLRFQPANPLDNKAAQSMSVVIKPTYEDQEYTLQLLLYDFETGSWPVINDTKWGENELDIAWNYVSPDGDVYARLHNLSMDQIVDLNNFGISLAILNSDGNVEIHGMTP